MFVFTFFREFAPAMHLAISDDLLHWQELNHQEPMVESHVGAKYWRDPFLIQDRDGIFHLLCTDGWASPSIIHCQSNNLIDWSDQQILPVMQNFPSAKNAWAPEACYDPINDEFRIFWSSTVEDNFPEHQDKPKDYCNHRIYACTTKDFKFFSKSECFFDPGYNCIDASIQFHNGIFLMAFKDERGNNSYFPQELARKHVLTATSSTLKGSWNINQMPVSKSTFSEQNSISNPKETWAEGPCVFYSKKTDEWWIFYEYFRNHQYGAVKSNDGKEWVMMDEKIQFPEGAKHGTVIEIENLAIIEALKAIAFPVEDD